MTAVPGAVTSRLSARIPYVEPRHAHRSPTPAAGVTVAGLRYGLSVSTLLSTISTFNAFTLGYLLTGDRPGGG